MDLDLRVGRWRRRRRRRRGEVGALDLAHLVGLEDVAFLHVVEAIEQDAALEPLLDLADVVLEALELGDRALLDDRAVANYPHLGATANDAVRDLAAGDRPQARDLEQRPHLGLAERLLGR